VVVVVVPVVVGIGAVVVAGVVLVPGWAQLERTSAAVTKQASTSHKAFLFTLLPPKTF
jgi:hypothetical protein